MIRIADRLARLDQKPGPQPRKKTLDRALVDDSDHERRRVKTQVVGRPGNMPDFAAQAGVPKRSGDLTPIVAAVALGVSTALWRNGIKRYGSAGS